MPRKRKSSTPSASKFHRVPEMQIGNFTISRGDTIKIVGEHGTKFKFDNVVTNTETGSQWIDCFELHKGAVGAMRSFRMDRVKRIPNRRVKRMKKSVNRD